MGGGGGEMCPRNVTSVSAEKIDGVAGARPLSHRPHSSEKLDYWANLRKTQQAGNRVYMRLVSIPKQGLFFGAEGRTIQ